MIEPLCFSHTTATSSLAHPARDLLVLAMASLSKLLIVTLRPELRVTYVHTLSGDATTLPVLAWHFVLVQLSDKQRVIDPVLAFARDQTIYFIQVSDALCKVILLFTVVCMLERHQGFSLQCSGTVGWVTGRASDCKKLGVGGDDLAGALHIL